MAHLTNIGFKNFRGFKDEVNLEFKPITILTGPNSSGKSSVSKGLALLQSSLNESNLIDLKFEKSLALMGNMNSVLNNKDENLIFLLPFRWFGLSQEMSMKLEYEINTTNKNNYGILSSLEIRDAVTNEVVMSFNLNKLKNGTPHYVSETSWDSFACYTRTVNYKYLKSRLDELFEVLRIGVKCIKEFKNICNADEYMVPSKESVEFEKSPKKTQDELLLIINRFEKTKEHIPLDRPYDPSIEPYSFAYNNPYLNPIFEYVREGHNCISFIEHFERSLSPKDRDNLLPKLYNENFPIFDYTFLNTQNLEYYKSDLNIIDQAEADFKLYLQGTDTEHAIDEHSMFLSVSPFSDEPYEKDIFDMIVDDLEYKIKLEEISKGNNYKIFKDFLNQSIRNILVPLKSICNSDNLEFIPSIRSIPSRVSTNGGTQTYFNDIVNKVSQIIFEEKELEFFKNWLAVFEIADDVLINPVQDTGFSTIKLKVGDTERHLIDVGYGFSQLLPILIKVALLKSNIISVEEPETNLHPALQSKLADFFVEANKKFGIQFIIETHSEYLIRRMQYLVAKDEIESSDVNLYYFYKPGTQPENSDQVKRINFESNGMLDDSFGPGFTDESDRLALDLYRLNRAQAN